MLQRKMLGEKDRTRGPSRPREEVEDRPAAEGTGATGRAQEPAHSGKTQLSTMQVKEGAEVGHGRTEKMAGAGLTLSARRDRLPQQFVRLGASPWPWQWCPIHPSSGPGSSLPSRVSLHSEGEAFEDNVI